MKKILSAVLAAALLGGCATSSDASSFNGLNGTGIGGSLVKIAVENQCRAELNKRSEWRLTALAMSAEKQAEWESRICGCVTEEAPNQLTGNDVMQMLDASTRNQAIASVTTKTVTACVKRLFR